MLKKLRWRFIYTAMTAFGLVMLLLAAGINGINYSVTARRQDERIGGILEYEKLKALRPPGSVPLISEMPWAVGPEADYTTRFFVVYCDGENRVTRISSDHISSVDETAIRQYTADILTSGREKGYYGEYRYQVRQEDTGATLVFLNVSDELGIVHSLFRVSLVIAVVSLLLVFGLIVILSQRAVRPYISNMERQKQFITDAGHELKTPLTSISTSADILAMEDEENEWIRNIQKQSARMSRLVSDLVALSRLDEETPFLEETAFSLSDMAWEAAEPFAALAKAGGKTYTQHIEEGLVYAGDKNAIRQLLTVLLDNAVRYSDEGGKIRLDVYRKYGKLCFEVFNTCELPSNLDLSRLFDRFYRPDESRSVNTGGTGIGLSMAQAIAEAHGGKIAVSSADGSSILFKVTL